MQSISNDPFCCILLLLCLNSCSFRPINIVLERDFICGSNVNVFKNCCISSDEDLHKIMDINKVFPKPPEVEEQLKRKKEEDEKRAEKEELQRIKSLAPPVQHPKMSQLIEEIIVSNFTNIFERIT